MKKIFYFLLVISFAVLSCNKEPINNQGEDPIENNEGVQAGLIPETITGVIADGSTKTAYGADGDFTWTASDQVRLIVTPDLSTYSPQGIYTYYIPDGGLSSDSKTATFTSTGSAGALIDFDNSGTYKSTGYAMYPASVLNRFQTPGGEAHQYGVPWFTLGRSDVSGTASDIILIGINDNSINNFQFSTAMSVLKITMGNIPANAAAIKLCTSDKTDYPVDGDFGISTGTDGKAALTFFPTWASNFKGYQKVDLSGQGAISSADYYFNIPAANYPAGTLSIVVEDANGGQIFKRTINKALSLARNDCLEMPPLAFSYKVAFKANTPASDPVITWTIDCKRIRFCVSTNATIMISEFNGGYTFANDLSTGSSSGEYNLSSFVNQRPSNSGQYYMHYILQSDRGGLPSSLDAANVITYGTIPFYYLSSADAGTFAKQYSFTSVDSGSGQNFWHPGTSSNYTKTMTLAASTDCSKGNLMISELYGKNALNKPLYGILTSSNASSITFAYNGDGESDYFFQQGNYFHVAQSADGWASHSSDDVVFAISAGPVLTNPAYLMMKYTASYPASWGQFVYGYQLVFN